MATNVPMATPSPKIFSPQNKRECKDVVRLLKKETVIALDSEGVQLGKDGPLTLLQIGTLDGRVYLFDVMRNEREQDKTFFKESGLSSVLTSTDIVKVIQSCSGDSAALYYQFNIRLENVFDTQVAHLVIQQHKGRRYPSMVKLAEICKLYSENADVYEGKEDVKTEWVKREGNFWAKRPMTKEMIEYASGDVTALIPDVYETQKRFIEEKGLGDLFAERVLEEIEYEIDSGAKERRKERNIAIKNEIIQEMSTKYRRGTDFNSITDEDEIKALNDTSVKELSDYTDAMKDLKHQSMKIYLKSVEEELADPEKFNPNRGILYKLNDIQHCGSDILQNEAVRIKRRVIEVVTIDIQKKYTGDTPLENISSTEYQIIRGLKPLSDDEPRCPRTVEVLHWKITEKEIKEVTEKLNADPDYNMTVPIPKLKFLTNNPGVPQDVKRVAQTLVDRYESNILEGIPKKYTRNTSTNQLSDAEKIVIERLRLSSRSYDPVVVSLHWKIASEKLTTDLENYRNGKLHVNDGFRGKLNFFKSNASVPDAVKQKAIAFLRELPQRSQANKGRGRRY